LKIFLDLQAAAKLEIKRWSFEVSLEMRSGIWQWPVTFWRPSRKWKKVCGDWGRQEVQVALAVHRAWVMTTRYECSCALMSKNYGHR